MRCSLQIMLMGSMKACIWCSILCCVACIGIVSCTSTSVEIESHEIAETPTRIAITSTEIFQDHTPAITPDPSVEATSTMMPAVTTVEITEQIRVEEVCENLEHSTHQISGDDRLNNYIGTLGAETIGMTLIYSGNSISGTYFHRQDLIDHELRGCLLEGRFVTLNIYNANDDINATVSGEFVEFHPRSGTELQRDLLVGEWLNVNGAESMPLYLTLRHTSGDSVENRYADGGADGNNDQQIEQAAQDFWQAVMQDDKEKVAGLIEFPISAYVDGRRIGIRTSSSFVELYDAIFTEEFKLQIENTIPHNMFTNWQGTMLSNGDIWFNAYGRIVAINNAHYD